MPQTKIPHTLRDEVSKHCFLQTSFLIHYVLCVTLCMYVIFISIFLHLQYIQESLAAASSISLCVSCRLCRKMITTKVKFYFNDTHTQRQTQIVFMFILYSCENSCRQRVFQLSLVHNAAACVSVCRVYACVSIFLVQFVYVHAFIAHYMDFMYEFYDV